MALNRAELVRRLEALERLVGTHPDIPWDVERFASFGDALVVRCSACGEPNVPADIWDVGRRMLDGGYETLFTVTLYDSEDADEEASRAAWRAAEDQAHALLQVLDALPSLVQRLREDAAEGDPLPDAGGVRLVAGPRHVWVDPKADPNQVNGIYEATVVVPPGCEIHRLSSRVCERGTKGCLFSHTGGGNGQPTT